jgi:hypothetical protein
MSKNTLYSSTILKGALFNLPTGMPVGSSHLREFGVSRQLAHHYVQSGWLKHLGRGYYLRVGDKLTAAGVVASLQANGVKVHLGGKSALALKGFAHYLNLGEETLTLYGAGIRSLPEWFQPQFKCILSNSVLFNEQIDFAGKVGLSRFNHEADATFVSEPERAVLEMLDLVPGKQTLEEARQIMEGLQSLRSEKMEELLRLCKKIKVKRLFWKVADEMQLPVLKKIDRSTIDFGAKADYILQGEKTLVLRNPNG